MCEFRNAKRSEEINVTSRRIARCIASLLHRRTPDSAACPTYKRIIFTLVEMFFGMKVNGKEVKCFHSALFFQNSFNSGKRFQYNFFFLSNRLLAYLQQRGKKPQVNTNFRRRVSKKKLKASPTQCHSTFRSVYQIKYHLTN